MSLSLSERQQAAVAAALTVVSVAVVVAAVGGVLHVVGLFLTRFSSVFLPLAVAAVASLVFKPYYEWFTGRLRLPATLAVAAVFVSILAPLAAFAWFFGDLVADQLGALIAQVPGWWAAGVGWVTERAPQVVEFVRRHSLLGTAGAAAATGQGAVMQGLQAVGTGALAVGAGLLSLLGNLLSWVVLPVYFAFFLMADEEKLLKVDHLLPFLKAETRRDVDYLFHEFVALVVSFFRGQLIIAFLQGVLYAVGFQLVGLSYGFVIGLGLGFLNIIPYLGNIIGLGTALPLAFFQDGGGLGRVAAVLVVFSLVQAVEAYVLTPRIMGSRTGLHPMVIIVAIFFWGKALGGIMGMILAIPLTAFLVVVWRLVAQKYVREIV